MTNKQIEERVEQAICAGYWHGKHEWKEHFYMDSFDNQIIKSEVIKLIKEIQDEKEAYGKDND